MLQVVRKSYRLIIQQIIISGYNTACMKNAKCDSDSKRRDRDKRQAVVVAAVVHAWPCLGPSKYYSVGSGPAFKFY